MKFLYLLGLLFLLACSQSQQSKDNSQTTEEAAEAITETAQPEKPYSQVVVSVDTMVTGDVVKETFSYQSFEGQQISYFDYSLENPLGTEADNPPDLWMLSMYEDLAGSYPGMKDTTLVLRPEEYDKSTYRFDENGMLTFYKDWLYEFRVKGNSQGQPTSMSIGIMDERSGKYGWFEVTRSYQRNLTAPATYLTINDQNLTQKERKSIVDYYVLITRSGIFQPEHSGGQFDVPNGYFEISDEGTGAGTYISQLVLFRKNDGTDYLAIASRSVEPVDYIWVSSPGPPSFYTFNGSSFDEVEGLLPELESGIFFPDSLETVSAQTYYVLPQKGLSISYNLNYDPVMDYCKNRLDDLEDNMSPEDFAAKKKQCEVFGNLEKTQIELAFNKESGRFEVEPIN